MEDKKFVCIVCPRGCQLLVKKINDEYIITGNACKRGSIYGYNEVTNPKRVITSTVKLNNSNHRRLPVISNDAIPKALMFDVMKEINRFISSTPVKIGDILIKNVLNTGVDIIASRTID